MKNNFFGMNLLCIILLLFILTYSLRNSKNRTSTLIINRVNFFIILSIFSDVIYSFIDGKSFPGSLFIYNFFMILYFSSASVSLYFWMCYTHYELFKSLKFSKRERIFVSLPLIIIIVMTVSSPLTHWIYYIDTNNFYQRGSLYIIQPSISYGYILFAAVLSFIHYKTEIIHERKLSCLNLCFYTILPAFGGVFQIFDYGINTAMPSIFISIVMIYFDNLHQEKAMDNLTKLYNRGQFDRYLYEKIKNFDSERSHLLFFDVNDFKAINDRYGHIEGDKSLICVSQVLQKVFAGSSSFLARYGGDEFAVVIDARDIRINSLINEINRNLLNLSKYYPYNLSLAVGISKFSECHESYEKLIKLADKRMYECKKRMKKTV